MMNTGIKLRSCSHAHHSALSIFFLLIVLGIVNLEAHRELDYNGISNSTEEYLRQNGISHFRLLNRKVYTTSTSKSYLHINITSKYPTIMDDEMINVTISGIQNPRKSHWVAMISPSESSLKNCPMNTFLYKETGDLSDLPLLCHYPVRAQYVSNDPAYLGCKKKECRKRDDKGACKFYTCSATLSFHVVNFRTPVEFVLFSKRFKSPKMLKRSDPVQFTNPDMPLHGRLSSIDSTGTSMRLSWVSGSKRPQRVVYGDGQSATSVVSTFTRDEMCGSSKLPSPAMDFGWHDPGYIHTAPTIGLKPSSKFSYKYGSELAGWSDEMELKTPPAGGSAELTCIIYGDMGKAPLDKSLEHYIQPGSLSVINAIKEEIADEIKIDSIFHIGDISYATGFLIEWDYFLKMIQPLASRVSYMTAIGNHERDFPMSGSIYPTMDSGGECGVPYEAYFPMTNCKKDKPWYSIEQGPVHFTVISTEHPFNFYSDQYKWMKKDLKSVNRSRTPWVIVAGHRPMYSSKGGKSIYPALIDPSFVLAVEPVLMRSKVDIMFVGHHHNYERTCAVYNGKCYGTIKKDKNGVETYYGKKYTAPVHIIAGMAGFALDPFTTSPKKWSLTRISEFGYVKLHATTKTINVQFVNAKTKLVRDNFQIVKYN